MSEQTKSSVELLKENATKILNNPGATTEQISWALSFTAQNEKKEQSVQKQSISIPKKES